MIICIYYYVDIWNIVQYVMLCSVKTVLCIDQLLCRLEFKRLVCFWRTVESDESESERRQLMKRESVRRPQQIVYDKALSYKVGDCV